MSDDLFFLSDWKVAYDVLLVVILVKKQLEIKLSRLEDLIQLTERSKISLRTAPKELCGC